MLYNYNSCFFSRVLLETTFQIHQPKCMTEKIGLEKQVLEHAQREWEGMAPIGSSFSKQIQKDVKS